MPLYEYQCDDCGVRFERKQPITADPLKTCPECAGEVRRLLHPVGILFKGKGFYVTDNRKAKSSTAIHKMEKSLASKAKTSSSAESKSSAKSD